MCALLRPDQPKQFPTLIEYAVEHASDLIYWADPAGSVIYANEAARARTGYTTGELRRLHLWDFDQGLSKDTWAESWQALKQANSLTRERVHRTKAGGTYPVELSMDYVTFHGEEWVFLCGRDLSAQRAFEEQLRVSRERYRRLVDTTSELIFSFDEGMHFDGINRAAAQAFTGGSVKKVVGRHISEIGLPEDTWRAWEAIGGRVLASGRVVHQPPREVELWGGRSSFLETDLWPIRSSAGSVVGVRGVSRDVSERVRAEAALRESEERLRQSQKMEAIGQLAGGIAHDFNNLLTAIIGYSDLLLADDVIGALPHKHDLEEIRKAAERAAALTGQILAFSRRQALKPEVVSLTNVLDDLEPLLRRTLGEHIDLASLSEPDLGLTLVDVHQFEQMLLNLVVNARDAMPQGGGLTIELTNVEIDADYCGTHPESTPGSYVMLAVSDTGVGMDEATQERAFEPFFTTKKVGTGTGLGLSTVHGIVKQSGGTIYVYSAPEKGTTFRICLPRVEDCLRAAATPPATPLSATGTETIMLVEDEFSLRELIERVLQEAGYRVFSFESADAALPAFDRKEVVPDLLLTDLVLPGVLQGRELGKRTLFTRPNLRILYMSGYAHNAIIHDGRLDQGVDFLEKPFAPDTLTRTVREVLDRRR